MKLEAAKNYVFAINEKQIPGVGFQNEYGQSAAPYYIVFQTSGTPRAQDAAPRAIRTSPAPAAQEVNPATAKSIVVIFDRAMKTTAHGLHLFEEKKPVDLKSASFTYSPDGKTFTLNYAFKSATHYEVQMNSTEDIGFAAINRVPLWPVRFAFTTGQPR